MSFFICLRDEKKIINTNPNSTKFEPVRSSIFVFSVQAIKSVLYMHEYTYCRLLMILLLMYFITIFVFWEGPLLWLISPHVAMMLLSLVWWTGLIHFKFAFQHFLVACLEFVSLKHTNTRHIHSANCLLTALGKQKKETNFLGYWNVKLYLLLLCMFCLFVALYLSLYWLATVIRFKTELFAPNQIHSDLEFKWAISFPKNLSSIGRFGRCKKCYCQKKKIGIHSFSLYFAHAQTS